MASFMNESSNERGEVPLVFFYFLFFRNCVSTGSIRLPEQWKFVYINFCFTRRIDWNLSTKITQPEVVLFTLWSFFFHFLNRNKIWIILWRFFHIHTNKQTNILIDTSGNTYRFSAFSIFSFFNLFSVSRVYLLAISFIISLFTHIIPCICTRMR